MKVYRITPGPGMNPCCEKDIKEILTWFEEAEVGDVIKVRVMEMPEAEYNALPKYMGP